MSSPRLQLYRPLISNRVTQRFGENRACVDRYGEIVTKRGDACPANTRPYYPTRGLLGHNGFDYAAWHGEHIFHCGVYDGWMEVEKDGQGGIGVDVISNEPLRLQDGSYSYIKTRYWHLKSPVGHDGKKVKLGQVIGLADNTGASSADHLHFGVKRCDQNGHTHGKDNGYYGAFDPAPYMKNDTDAKTAAEFLKVPPPPLSNQERKEVNAQLSSARRLLLSLRALLNTL